MHLQVLSSGSGGNSALVRAGEMLVLVDAGLGPRELGVRLEAARTSARALEHLVLTHGHLDHARSAGILGRRNRELTVHCCERLLGNRSIRRARRLATLGVGRPSLLSGARAQDELWLTPVKIPHDADPTVAFKLEHGGRRAVIVTDMGHPSVEAARALADPDLLVLEFNYDVDLLASGPYHAKLKQRIAGPVGHLSNEQGALMLRLLAGPRLHTLVLAHLSETNNRAELALDAARATLADLGLSSVRVLVASQDEVGPNLVV